MLRKFWITGRLERKGFRLNGKPRPQAYCVPCDKRSHATRAAAGKHLSRLCASGADRAETLHVYACPAGRGLHIGHAYNEQIVDVAVTQEASMRTVTAFQLAPLTHQIKDSE